MLELIEAERGTVVLGVPTMLIAMLEHPDAARRDLSSLKVVASGGSSVPPELVRSFSARFGVRFSVVYGQTESSPLITMVRPGAEPEDAINTIGQPMPNTEVKIVDPATGAVVPCGVVGELCTRGYHLMQEYFELPEATAAAVDGEGWLHTGDVARWEDGPAGRELRIVDRKKDIMITAGGKNITPSEIENALRFSPYIKEAVVIADRRRFVSALIQIEFDSTAKWAEEQGLTYTTFKSLVELQLVRDLVAREVDAVNAGMPQVQQVRKFHLLIKELDHDDGEVTATMKVRRKNVGEKYAHVIESLYA